MSDDIWTIIEAESGNPNAGFAMLRKMFDASIGEYIPSECEREYFRRCRDKVVASKRPRSDPKQIQRDIAGAFNLVRRRGGQRKDDMMKIAMEVALREKMKTNGGNQEQAIRELGAEGADIYRAFGGVSDRNLRRAGKQGRNVEISNTLGWKNPATK